jgi:hypothetical protein
MTVSQFITENPAVFKSAMIAKTGIAKNSTAVRVESAYATLSEADQQDVLVLAGYDQDAVATTEEVSVSAPTISGVTYLTDTSKPSKTFPNGKATVYAVLAIDHFTNSRNPVVNAGNVEIAVMLGTLFSLYAEKNPLKVGDLIAVKMQSDMYNGNENGLHTKNINGRMTTMSQLCAGAMPEFQSFIEELEAHNASKPTKKTEIARLQANSQFKMSHKEASAILDEENRVALAEYNRKRTEARVFKY